MNNYSQVKPENCEVLECLADVYNLFALFDTPANVIFVDQFINNIQKYKDIFAQYSMPENIFFACKSNKSYALLSYAADQNCGIEVSSVYELIDALKYSNRIIASGPKDSYYLEKAIHNHVLVSVDDIEELKEIIKFDEKVKVLLRISDLLNKVSRFGINISQIDECITMISNSKVILEGFSFHINNYFIDNRIEAINQIISIVQNKKLKIKYIDIGGGFPTNYCSKKDFKNFIRKNNERMYFNNHFIQNYYPYYSDVADENVLHDILKKTHKLLKQNHIELIIEPGRSLLKNVGVSIFSVLYLKELFNHEKILVTNGNINFLSEQWFSSDYLIEPQLISENNRDKETIYASVAGNLCLEQDMLTWRKIKFDFIPQRGDLLVYYNTAGYQMDSNESEFHKIPLPKKYIVKRKNVKFSIREDREYDSK